MPWKAKAAVIDTEGAHYTATFDQVMSFLRMPVFTMRDRARIAAGVAAQLASPGPKSCFDGAELANYDRGETLDALSRKVLGDKGTRYITIPYMGFLYAVPLAWLSTPLFARHRIPTSSASSTTGAACPSPAPDTTPP